MYSQQNAAIPSPQHFSNHQATKTHSIRYGSNSDLTKRTRNQSYELSQDLIDKQIELLERKYGGNVRAQRAALVSFYTADDELANNLTTFSIRLGYPTGVSAVYVKSQICFN